MAQINFNAQEQKEINGYDPLPSSGWYLVKAIDSDYTQNSNKTGMLAKFTCEVIEPLWAKGRILLINFNHTHQNPKAQEIGRGQLTAYCNAIHMPQGLQDTVQAHEQPFLAKVHVEVDGQRLSNDVKMYKPTDYNHGGYAPELTDEQLAALMTSAATAAPQATPPAMTPPAGLPPQAAPQMAPQQAAPAPQMAPPQAAPAMQPPAQAAAPQMPPQAVQPPQAAPVAGAPTQPWTGEQQAPQQPAAPQQPPVAPPAGAVPAPVAAPTQPDSPAPTAATPPPAAPAAAPSAEQAPAVEVPQAPPVPQQPVQQPAPQQSAAPATGGNGPAWATPPSA